LVEWKDEYCSKVFLLMFASVSFSEEGPKSFDEHF